MPGTRLEPGGEHRKGIEAFSLHILLPVKKFMETNTHTN